MKKYANLIISFASLFVTLFLLILSIFGWYVVNEKATASGIIGAAEALGGHFDFYCYKDTSNTETPNYDWVLSNNNLKISDAWPDDVFYFKIVGSGLNVGQSINVAFDGVSSIIDTNVVTANYDSSSSKYNVYYRNLLRYSSNSDSIIVNYDGVNKTLYSIEEDQENNTYNVALEDIKIQDMFNICNPSINSSGFPTDKGTILDSITGDIFNGTVTNNDGSITIYFALYYKSAGDALDNFYQYQGINISCINITAS